MAFNIGSYGGQQPQDNWSGVGSDPMAQQGLMAALQAMQPKIAPMGQPQQKQSQGGGGMPGMGGQSPMSNMLFGQPGGTGTAGQGLLGDGGFGNTVSGLFGGGAAPAAGAGAAGAAGAGAAGGAAAGAGAGAAAGAGADAAAGAGADAAGAAALALWIVCTELMRQGRLPMRWWVYGSKEFASYSDTIKRGYYFFAIPAVHHLRRSPGSRLSKLLEVVFNARAEYLAARGGCHGARRTWRGALCTHGLIPIGWLVGTFFVREMPDWQSVYAR